MMQQFGEDVSQRIDQLSPEEKNTAKEFMNSPAAAIMSKIFGPELINALPLDKLLEDAPEETAPKPEAPSGLASRETPMKPSAAAPVAAERTGLAARPMQ